MQTDHITALASKALELTITISLPIVLAAMAVGLVVSILQAATQVQEQTLATVPKIIAVFIVLLVAGAGLLSRVSQFMTSLYGEIPGIGR